MNVQEFLKSQLQNSKFVLETFLSEVPNNYFFKKSARENSNIAWQVGHLCLATYSLVVSRTGKDKEFLPPKNFQELMEHCKGLGDLNRFLSPDVFTRDELMQKYADVHQMCYAVIDSLTPAELSSPKLDTPFPHKFSKTKLDIIGYAIRHEMWHCSEIEGLKREFGLNHVFVPQMNVAEN